MNETAAYSPKTLPEVFADLWNARGWMVFGMVLGAVFAFVFVAFSVPHYRAQMVISPANPMNGAEVSSLLADDNLFALRYLAQRVGVSTSSDFMRFETTYAGPSVAAVLLEDDAIRLGLEKDWRFTFIEPEKDWNSATLAEYIDERVRLGNIGTTTQKRMTYSHPSPEFAAYFLQQIHRVTDELIRKNIREAASGRVEYLQQAVADRSLNPEHRRALTTLLLEQERLRMLVSIESPYAATVIEPPAALARPVWPDVPLVYVLSLMVSAVFGFTVYGFRAAAKDQKNAAQKPAKKQKRWYKDDHKNTNEQFEGRPSDREAG